LQAQDARNQTGA